MRNIREVLQYHFEYRRSNAEIARALQVSKGSVHNILSRFTASGIAWPLEAQLSDSVLEERLYPQTGQTQEAAVALPDIAYVNKELSRRHVTLELLWREYHDAHPDGQSRASFYRHCGQKGHIDPPMKMIYVPGDKLFVDYSGDGLEYINRFTGEIIPTDLFVCAWGATSYSYAEATETQKAVDFTMSHVRAFEYFQGLPQALVPDNAKCAVAKPDRYEPKVAPLFHRMAQHYGVAVIPARIRKPRDKAVVESAVGFVQRYILGRLRNRRFFSLAEINQAIQPELDALNREPMQAYGGQSRLERFEEIERPMLRALPAERFILNDVKLDAPVAPNYHVNFDRHFYSVPHHLSRKCVDIYQSGDVLEIYHEHVHVFRHRKQPPNYGYTTIDEHMPPNHRFVRGWSCEWFISKAQQIGESTAILAAAIMKRNRHPQQGFNSVLGILNLAKQYEPARVEQAATRALRLNAFSYHSVKSILDRNLDIEEMRATQCVLPLPINHENIRGADYFSGQASTNPNQEVDHAS
jgi:transposase